MTDPRTRLEEAVADFRAWAARYPVAGRSGDWECGYADWPVICTAFEKLLQSQEPEQWDGLTIDLLLYSLARDNEVETLKSDLTEHPMHLLALAKAGLQSAECDARWQLADALGAVQADEDDIGPLLTAYAADDDEYVSRRALLALGRRRSPAAEALALKAWETGHEYQRMAALEVLSNVGSADLPSYLDRAVEDGRQYLVGTAEEIRRGKSSAVTAAIETAPPNRLAAYP